MNSATYDCPLCQQIQPAYFLLSHIPQCYISFCEKGQILPFCTCNDCRGNRTHPGQVCRPARRPDHRDDRGHEGSVNLTPRRERESNDLLDEWQPPRKKPAIRETQVTTSTEDLQDPRFVEGTCCLLTSTCPIFMLDGIER